MKILSMPAGGAAIPMNLLTKSWTVDPTNTITVSVGTPVECICLAKTPVINNNTLNYNLWNCGASPNTYWVRIYVSTDGNTWNQLGGTNGSGATGYQSGTISLASYNGSELYVKVEARSADSSVTAVPAQSLVIL